MRILIAMALVLTFLAGCSDDPAPEAQDESFEDFGQDLEATATTGILRGVVVDAAVLPVPGVLVTIQGLGITSETDDNGLFGFDGLEAGAYFLELSKLGYTSVQANADVVAGEDQPPIVKVRMLRDLSYQPFASTIYHKGYYQCGLAFVVVCGAPNNLADQQVTDDTSTHTFYFETRPTFVQTEMVWDTTQTVSPDLRLEVETLDAGCEGGSLINNTLGPSPLRIIADEAVLNERAVGGPDCGLYHSVFAGDMLEQAHCSVWVVPLVKCGVGFSIEQSFEWFITEFHGFLPDEDWWYIVDGAPVVPS